MFFLLTFETVFNMNKAKTDSDDQCLDLGLWSRGGHLQSVLSFVTLDKLLNSTNPQFHHLYFLMRIIKILPLK